MRKVVLGVAFILALALFVAVAWPMYRWPVTRSLPWYNPREEYAARACETKNADLCKNARFLERASIEPGRVRETCAPFLAAAD